MRRFRSPLFLALVAVVVSVTIASATWIAATALYDRLTFVESDCGGGYAGQSPALYDTGAADPTPYLMPDYDPVTFPARGDPSVTISAWWIPGRPGAPAIVLAHGSHECRRATTVLRPAGMLHRHGYGALVIDLRNQGASTVVNRRIGGGVTEARDVLGAWDWLRHEQGLPPDRIGLYGVSLGAGAVVIAEGMEPGVAAAWEDSGFADIEDVLAHQTGSTGWPSWLAGLGLEVGRLRGDDMFAPSPETAARAIGIRGIAVVHGTGDRNVPIEHEQRLVRAVETGGGQPQVWIVDGAHHTEAQFCRRDEYERRLVAFFGTSLGWADSGP